MRLLIGLLGVAALIIIASLNDDTAEPKVCTTCGVRSMYSHYVGHGKPLHWVCTKCGAERLKT